MPESLTIWDDAQFSEQLYQLRSALNPGLAELELYEFRYALANLTPPQGWASITPPPIARIKQLITELAFFEQIQLKLFKNGRIHLDESILNLTRQLLVGLLNGSYSLDWLKQHFYFDLRAFVFFVRSEYYTQEALARFGNFPYFQGKDTHNQFACQPAIGYKAYQQANLDIDQAFFGIISQLVRTQPQPLLLSLVGPSAAGKTELVARLSHTLQANNFKVSVVEVDNFLKDRTYRDGRPSDLDVMHFDSFKQGIQTLLEGREANIPRYDFQHGTSSHDLQGELRPGCSPLRVAPAEVILLEGNLPFHLPQLGELSGIRMVYLADDWVRLKRKWWRDIDLRKKYDPAYFVNRYFQTQFLRAEQIYRPLIAVCDLLVDTSAAAIYLTPCLQQSLAKGAMTPHQEASHV